MSKKQYEMRAKFIEGYCEHGNATKAARDAGYKDGKYITNQAGNLKRQLGPQIMKRMQQKFVDETPKAFSAMKNLMDHSDSDTVKYQCAKDMMDRAGFKPKDKLAIEEEKKSVTELEAELVSLVGRDKANILLNKTKEDKKSDPSDDLENGGWAKDEHGRHELSTALN